MGRGGRRNQLESKGFGEKKGRRGTSWNGECRQADGKGRRAVEEVINGNEDCLAKCEWATSGDMDGRMGGWWWCMDGWALHARARVLRLEEIQMHSPALTISTNRLILPPARFYYPAFLFTLHTAHLGTRACEHSTTFFLSFHSLISAAVFSGSEDLVEIDRCVMSEIFNILLYA